MHWREGEDLTVVPSSFFRSAVCLVCSLIAAENMAPANRGKRKTPAIFASFPSDSSHPDVRMGSKMDEATGGAADERTSLLLVPSAPPPPQASSSAASSSASSSAFQTYASEAVEAFDEDDYNLAGAEDDGSGFIPMPNHARVCCTSQSDGLFSCCKPAGYLDTCETSYDECFRTRLVTVLYNLTCLISTIVFLVLAVATKDQYVNTWASVAPAPLCV